MAYAEQKEIIGSPDGKQSLADSDLAALNRRAAKGRGGPHQRAEHWEQAKASTGLGLPQILSDGAI